MKREKTPRELRMGCGESLAARVPPALSGTTKMPPADAMKTRQLKKGEGRR
ncbi:MAG: hypothetical protein KJN79_12665 [Gammaproteobacteria bacterium]|nr:hypothetical protein [Gammaproteobacteria bacterium]